METSEESTIMIVDDQPENVKLLIPYLKNSGFRISVAQSGEEAIRRMKRSKPDIVLLDVKMPGIDGFETCRRLKNDDATREIPVIFVIGATEMGDKLPGFQAGGVDYIIKPFQHEEVLARVNTHLTIRKLQQQLHAQNVRLQETNKQLQAEISVRKRAEEALRVSRELQNELQRYLVEERLEFIENERVEQNGGSDLESVQQGLSFREAVEAYEKRLIVRALAQNAGHQGKTAEMLDIPPRTLYEKIKKYRLKEDKV